MNINQEKINLLIVCLGNKWTASEVNAFYNCILFKEKGYGVYLYCLKNSILCELAKKAGITCISPEGKISFKIWNWTRLGKLHSLLFDYNISIIHCYEIRLIWVLAYFLRKHPFVPLVLSVYTVSPKFYTKVWHKILKRRIDYTIIPTLDYYSFFKLILNIPKRKIGRINGPLIKSDQKDKSFHYALEWQFPNGLAKFYKDHWLIGTEISSFKNILDLKNLLNSLKIIKQDFFLGKRLHLLIFSPIDWNKNPYYSSICRILRKNEIKDVVSFIHLEDVSSMQTHMDIWFSFPNKEVLNRSFLSSIFNGVPAIIPKGSEIDGVFSSYPNIFRVYKEGDMRQIIFSLKEILENYEGFLANIDKSSKELTREYERDYFSNSLEEVYLFLLRKRKRAYLGRKIKFRAKMSKSGPEIRR